MRPRHCTIIGAGLTGAMAARTLTDRGWDVTILEAEDETGGNCRLGRMGSVVYERHGPHIFHTSDDEMAALAKPYLRDYVHTVSSVTEAGTLSWPPQLQELAALPQWKDIRHELAMRPEKLPEPASVSFRDYAVALMGETLYHLFIEDYTWKQWNRDPGEMSGIFAPKRIDLRTDGYRPLFRDPFQGWLNVPAFINDLTDRAEIFLGEHPHMHDIPRSEPCIVTAPLDIFVSRQRQLEWRGMKVSHRYMPSPEDMPSPVVNYPQLKDSHIRVTSAAAMGNAAGHGDVLSYETPCDDVMDYPVNDVTGVNRRLQTRLRSTLTGWRPLMVPAGRLGTYTYLNMDQAMRQGFNAALKILRMAE